MTAKYFVTQSTSGKWFICNVGDASYEPVAIFDKRTDALHECLEANIEADQAEAKATPETAPEPKRGPGRPAKYSSNVERQAAYNQRKRDAQAQAERERLDRVAKRKAAVRGAQMYAGSTLIDFWKAYECGDERKGYLKQIIDQLQAGQLHITIDET